MICMIERREFIVGPVSMSIETGMIYAIREYIGNRLEIIFQGTKQDCYIRLRELQSNVTIGYEPQE